MKRRNFFGILGVGSVIPFLGKKDPFIKILPDPSPIKRHIDQEWESLGVPGHSHSWVINESPHTDDGVFVKK